MNALVLASIVIVAFIVLLIIFRLYSSTKDEQVRTDVIALKFTKVPDMFTPPSNRIIVRIRIISKKNAKVADVLTLMVSKEVLQSLDWIRSNKAVERYVSANTPDYRMDFWYPIE